MLTQSSLISGCWLKLCPTLRIMSKIYGLHYSTAVAHPSSCSYVMNKVKTYDYENYLLVLLSPKKFRYPMFVIHAYNVELSLVLESVSDSKIAAGRFAFWGNALEGIFGRQRPYDHPVVQELDQLYHLNLINTQQSKKSLTHMLTSRQDISSVTHLESMSQLETYAEHTKTSLLYLTLAIAGHSSVDTDHASSHLGRCNGLVTALRATQYLASRNQLLLPQEVLSKHGVSQTDVIRGREAVKEPVFEIASQANIHLEKSKELIQKFPKEVRKYFLSAAICEYQLELLRKIDFNVFDPRFHKKNTMLPWKLWRASKRL